MRSSSRFAAFVTAFLIALNAFCGDARAGPREDRIRETSPVTALSREDLEQTRLSVDVLQQLNAARTDPQGFADTVRNRPRLRGIGAADMNEALAFLDNQQPLPPLTYGPALGDVALFHARDIGTLGLTSHTGSNGATMGGRMRARGLTPTVTAEELAFGGRSGTDVILQLIIDRGVPGKPHRQDLFSPRFTFAGVGCAPHKTLQQVCVINLSNGFMRPPPAISLPPTPTYAPLFDCPPGLGPADPDAVRTAIFDQYGGQAGGIPQEALTVLASATGFGQQHLAEELGQTPGRYNTLGSPPWTPPADLGLLPRFCGVRVPGVTTATRDIDAGGPRPVSLSPTDETPGWDTRIPLPLFFMPGIAYGADSPRLEPDVDWATWSDFGAFAMAPSNPASPVSDLQPVWNDNTVLDVQVGYDLGGGPRDYRSIMIGAMGAALPYLQTRLICSSTGTGGYQGVSALSLLDGGSTLADLPWIEGSELPVGAGDGLGGVSWTPAGPDAGWFIQFCYPVYDYEPAEYTPGNSDGGSGATFEHPDAPYTPQEGDHPEGGPM